MADVADDGTRIGTAIVRNVRHRGHITKAMGETKAYRDLIWIDPSRVGGMPGFDGTRVPVAHLFDYLGGGYSIEEFARRFVLSLEQVKGVLEAPKAGLWRELEAA